MKAELSSEPGDASEAARQPADLQVLAALVGSDPFTMDRVLAAFLRGTDRSRAVLRQSIGAGSTQAVLGEMHKLKPGVRAIGARRLDDICTEMEDAAKAGPSNEWDALLARFEIELDAVNLYLESARTGTG